MTLMIDPRHIWNVIYNARSNRCHPPTSPSTVPATKNDSHQWSSTYLTSFTMRGATELTLQHHQILHLPRRMTRMIDARNIWIWNVIYNARSNRSVSPTSPNTAPATQNDSHDWSASHMKCYLQCAEQQRCLSNITKYCAFHTKWLSWLIRVTYETLFTMRRATEVALQHHQILRLPRKLTLQNFAEMSPKQLKRHLQCGTDPRMIRAWSDHETVSPQPASQPRLLFALAAGIFYWKVQHLALQLPFQISPNTVPATKSDTWTSPNTEPATQNDSHDWSASHMKCYLQCAEQQRLPSNITKYCACHTKWLSWLIRVTYERLFTMSGATEVALQHHQILRLPRKMILQNFAEIFRKQLKRHLQCGTDPRMIWAWSDHDPTMKPSVRNPPRNRGYFSRSPLAFSIEKCNIWRSSYHSRFHQILCLPQKVTLELHQILRLPHKMTLMIDPRHIWNVIYNVRSNRGYPPTSPNTAACHTKWLSWLIRVTYERLFTMRGATEVALQHHQILRLPRKMILQNFAEISPKQLKRHLQCGTDPRMIRAWNRHSATRLATEVAFRARHEHFLLQNTTFCAPAIIPNFTQGCTCHEKWHLNFTKLRLPRKVPLELHQIVHLARKVTLEL